MSADLSPKKRPHVVPEEAAPGQIRDLQAQVDRLGHFNLDTAHDLRGPLGSIELLAALAQQQLDGGDLDAARQSLRRLGGQARDAQATLDALLRLSGALGAAPQRLDIDLGVLAQAAAEAAALVLAATHPGARLPSVQVAPLGRARTDPGLLHTVLLNLIGNSLKFNLDHADLGVTVRREPDADGSVVLVVSDNGVGFDASTGEAALAPSGPLEPGAILTGEGRGLGIVRRAVAHLGGTVTFRSRRGQGTTVRFTLGRG